MVSLTAVVVSLASNDGAKVKGSLEPQLFSAILSVFIIVPSRFHRCSRMVMKNRKKNECIFLKDNMGLTGSGISMISFLIGLKFKNF